MIITAARTQFVATCRAGTLPCMSPAPEIFIAPGNTTYSAHLWSLGTTMFDLAACTIPFQTGSSLSGQLPRAHASGTCKTGSMQKGAQSMALGPAWLPVHVVARLCGRGRAIYHLTPAGSSGFADHRVSHASGAIARPYHGTIARPCSSGFADD